MATPVIYPQAQRDPANWRVVAYYPSWVRGRGYLPANIPAARLTHINYAFAKPDAHGKCVLDTPAAGEENLPQLRALRSDNPHLRLLFSIGGGNNLDQPFANVVSTPESIASFSKSCLELMKKWDFDGLDLDWEFPKVEQQQLYTNLLSEMRRQLDEQSRKDGRAYLLTNAVPAGLWALQRMEVDKVASLLDWVNLMTYDFYGTWSKVTGHQAPLYYSPQDPQRLSADIAVKAYLFAGVPVRKLVLGVPFYGRGWEGVPATGGGLFQPYEKTFGSGAYEYREIKSKYAGIFTRSWDDAAKAPWLYSADQRVMITYDDPESVRQKAEYAHQNNLGGVMIWQIAGDDPESSLLRALAGY